MTNTELLKQKRLHQQREGSVQVPRADEGKERVVQSLNTAMVDMTKQELQLRQAHVSTVFVR